jgi:transcriptional regulator with XRE-family HTH domain
MTLGKWKDAFGDNLSALLREKNMTQKDLAIESGVSMGMISDYVNKFTEPSIFAIINMAYALDVDIDDLIDFGEPIEC